MSDMVPMYGFGCGGGGGLNFKVVGGTTQPTNHTENTIWVNTSVSITDWVINATEPTAPKEGMVWITTDKSSSAEFNALKKNGIMVYPISAKQYIGGAWVGVTAKSYQGGEWVDWITPDDLFYYSKQSYKWTGKGMQNSIGHNDTAKDPTITTLSDGSVEISLSSSGNQFTSCVYQMDDLIDFTSLNRVIFKGAATGTPEQVLLSIVPSGADAWGADKQYGGDSVAYFPVSSINKEYAIDVSALSGFYRVVIGVRITSSSGGCIIETVRCVR